MRGRSIGDDEERQDWETLHGDVLGIIIRRRIALSYNYAVAGG